MSRGPLEYQIHYKPAALKQLKKLARKLRAKIEARIEALAHNPRPTGVDKVEGEDDTYRIRCGDHRVIYEIHDSVLVVLVVKIGDRKDIYRNL